MTKKEAIKELSVQYLGDSDRMREAKDMAISALSAIEKIRAEIQENFDTYKEYRWEEEAKAYAEVLEIIDKHIKGKENTDEPKGEKGD